MIVTSANPFTAQFMTGELPLFSKVKPADPPKSLSPKRNVPERVTL